MLSTLNGTRNHVKIIIVNIWQTITYIFHQKFLAFS